jgi:hypothetical protein
VSASSLLQPLIYARIDIFAGQVGYDWDYFKFPELVTAELIPYGNNTFELVMVVGTFPQYSSAPLTFFQSNEFCRPCVLNTQVGGTDAYATSDLLVPHPVKSGYWKVYGRADDQIVHNTGEKVK